MAAIRGVFVGGTKAGGGEVKGGEEGTGSIGVFTLMCVRPLPGKER